MESEKNKRIREILEMFGVEIKKVIGSWNILGHLSNVFDELKKDTSMGVSQWMEHGKKYGYDRFFLEKIKNEEKI